jgi:integrase
MPAKSQLAQVVPTGKKRAVSAGRRSNAEYRKREHLTAAEIDKLIEAARGNRHGHRDATMILVAYRHGLRASEICELRWEDLNFGGATLNVSRKKSGTPSTHPLNGAELRALRRLQKEQESRSAYIFVNERGTPFDRAGFHWLSSAPVGRPNCLSRSMHICCGMRRATPWPTPARIPARSKPI